MFAIASSTRWLPRGVVASKRDSGVFSAGYVAPDAAPKKLVQALRDRSLSFGSTLFGENMQCEDFLAAFCCLLFVIERSKEICATGHGVVGPLFCCMEEECVAKETKAIMLLGEQWYFLIWGRAASTKSLRKPWEFDATRGYPGEDI